MNLARVSLALLVMTLCAICRAEDSKDPADAAGWVRRIQQLIEKDQVAAAMDELRVAMNAQLLREDGTPAPAAKEVDAAVLTAVDAKQLNRAAALNVLKAAITLTLKADLKEAIAILDNAEKQDPRLPEVFNTRGMCKVILKDYVGALKDIDAAIALNPNYVDAWANRSLCKAISGDKAGATKDTIQHVRLQNRISSQKVGGSAGVP